MHNFGKFKELAIRTATLIGAEVLKRHAEHFRIEDYTAVQDNEGMFSRCERVINVGTLVVDDGEFNMRVVIGFIAGGYSVRPMPYSLDVELYHQVSPLTPAFTYAKAQYGLAQENALGDGKPGDMGQLLKFKFDPHPGITKDQESITADSVLKSSEVGKVLNPLAKDLAQAVFVHF